MAYIGNARSLELYATNVRDDLIPDPGTSKVTFDLSQEVPGGYEANVVVLRRKFVYDELFVSTSITLSQSGNTLTCTNAEASLLLSTTRPGDSIKIVGSSFPGNEGLHLVQSVAYTSPNCVITFAPAPRPITDDEGPAVSLTITRAYDGPWEVLEPEIDYVIGGTGPEYNRLITLSDILQEEDVCYVIHRGSATYNFVPTNNSVGPDQLQENLRNFKYDRFTGDGVEDTFTLSQFAVNGKSIVVYVDGVVLEPNEGVYVLGDYTLDVDGITLTFATPPANLSKIRVLHLGFTTVSRRAALSDGQINTVGANTVGTVQLQNGSVTEPKLATNAVSNSKIQDNAVNGQKILLNNFGLTGDSLRGKRTDAVPTHLLYINSGNETVLLSDADMPFVRTGSGVKMRLDTLQLRPESDGGIGLGSAAQRYSHIYVNGTSRLGPTEVDTLQVNGSTTLSSGASVTGNISVTGTVDGVDVSNLNSQVQDIQINLIPAGSLIMTGRSTAPTGYLLCDGSIVSQGTYAALFAAIGTAYNTGGEGVGNFRLPDLRQRFPLGKAVSGTGSTLGSYGGTIDHTHTTADHNHTISHTHNIPGHYHLHDTGVSSSLAIASSGNHNTDLAHSHTNSVTPGGEGLHDHNLSAGHAITIASAGDHSHGHSLGVSFNTSGADRVFHHQHRSWPSSTVAAGTGASDRVGVEFARYSDQGTRSPNPSWEYDMHARGEDSTSHQHDEGTGSDKTYGLATAPEQGGNQQSTSFRFFGQILPWTTEQSAHNIYGQLLSDHVHGVTGSVNTGSINNAGSHTHTISGQVYNYGSGHQHTIVVNPVLSGTNSSSSGAHVHNTGDFSGSLGNVSGGFNGNNALTTNTQSTTVSGNAGAGNTGGNNPAFAVVNYIIKT